MFELKETTQFKKDLKKVFKRSSKDFELIFTVLEILKTKGIKGIPTQINQHKLRNKHWQIIAIFELRIVNPKSLSCLIVNQKS